MIKRSAANQEPNSIESGYFVFTLMPSLRCHLNCPHCYLSLEDRRHSETMSLENLQKTCSKIKEYYNQKKLASKTIICYWYGGEPTEMGLDFFQSAINLINKTFRKEEGYEVKHTILTSLLTIEEEWFGFFKKHCDHHVQTSFDGSMRGKNYVKKWQSKVKKATAAGLEVSTISVVNHELIKESPEAILDYLADLKIKETSWLPFMWNEENDGDPYRKYAPTMTEWSNFMIRLTQHARIREARGQYTPKIGQEWFISTQNQKQNLANIPGQTLFLMPNGDFVLPDYKNGFQEFMQPFGNILSQSFEEVLHSPARKKYLRKQVLRNHNQDCLACTDAHRCVMEFWKDNRAGDDCFGGKKYIQWLDQNQVMLPKSAQLY